MKEQSHKDEMSAAIQGDFERLRRRGVSTGLAPGGCPDDPVHVTVDLPPPETIVPAATERVEPARDGWLGRLLGRS